MIELEAEPVVVLILFLTIFSRQTNTPPVQTYEDLQTVRDNREYDTIELSNRSRTEYETVDQLPDVNRHLYSTVDLNKVEYETPQHVNPNSTRYEVLQLPETTKIKGET